MSKGFKTDWVRDFLFAVEFSGIEFAAPVRPVMLESLRAQHMSTLNRLAEEDGVGPYGPMAMSRVMPVWNVRIEAGPVMHEIPLDLMDPIENLFFIMETIFTFPMGVSLIVVRPQGEYQLLAGTPPVDNAKKRTRVLTIEDDSVEDMLAETANLLVSLGECGNVASIFPDMEMDLDPESLVDQALMQVEDSGVSAHTSELMKRRLEESDDLEQVRMQINQLKCDYEMDDATRSIMISMLAEQLDELCEIRKVQKMTERR